MTSRTFLWFWFIALLLVQTAALCQPPQKRTPEWIWAGGLGGGNRPIGERCVLTRTFELTSHPVKATLLLAADNHAEVFLNGRSVARNDSWSEPTVISLDDKLQQGMTEVVIKAENDGGPAGVLFQVDVIASDGTEVRWVSDPSFLSVAETVPGQNRTENGVAAPLPALSLGPWGTSPWGRVAPKPPPRFVVEDGFRVEEIATGFGSVIAICDDKKNGVFAAIEGGGVFHLRAGEGRQRPAAMLHEPLVRNCQGLLLSGESLFMVGEGPEGLGVYSKTKAEPPIRIFAFEGDGGEHGPHGLVQAADGRLLVAVGNHARVPREIFEKSPYRILYEGHCVPVILDPKGHATHVRAPGGIVLSLEPDGRHPRVLAGGMRNSYDLAQLPNGDLFAFDSDMEWDLGLPWYREVSLLHIVPGGEYGWRTGSSKWPWSAPDALPPAVRVGRGSPTGLLCYTGDSFPAAYHGKLLGADWSMGRILAFDLERTGVSYKGTHRTLVSGQPMNVTDLAMGADGSVVFSCGGRGTRGGIFRLSYTGPIDRSPPTKTSQESPNDPSPLALSSKDRFERFLAFRALESNSDARSLFNHAESAVKEGRELEAADALLAAVRCELRDSPPVPDSRTGSLALSLFLRSTDADVRLSCLRVMELVLCRKTPWPSEMNADLVKSFPTGESRLDRSLAQVLCALGADGTPAAFQRAFESSTTRSERLFLLYCARNLKGPLEDAMVSPWLDFLERSSFEGGGQSALGFLRAIREGLRNLSSPALAAADRAREARQKVSAAIQLPQGTEPVDFDRTRDLLTRLLESQRRQRGEGKKTYQRLCVACHQHEGLNGRGGPDLSHVGARFSVDDLLRSLTEPSREISDQYRGKEFFLSGGQAVFGLVVASTQEHLEVLTQTAEIVTVPKASIEEERVAKTSAMPSGLIDALTPEELADLFAFVLRKGPEDGPHLGTWEPMVKDPALGDFNCDPNLWSRKGLEIVGTAVDLPHSSFLIAKEPASDFILEASVHVITGNSGLQFRSRMIGENRLAGYQADLGERYFGSIYEEGGRGMLHAAHPELWEPYLHPHGWNHLVVTARGQTVKVELNGIQTVTLDDPEGARTGLIGVQLHAGHRTSVRVKDLRMMRLSEGAISPR